MPKSVAKKFSTVEPLDYASGGVVDFNYEEIDYEKDVLVGEKIGR